MVNYNIALEGKTVLVTGAAGFIGSRATGIYQVEVLLAQAKGSL